MATKITATKAIAVRVPLDEYIRFVTDASERKMTLSDYILVKLYASDQVAELESLVLTCQHEMVRRKQEVDESKTLLKEMTDKATQWQTHARGLTDQNTALKQQVSDWEKKGLTLRTENQQLMNQSARLQDTIGNQKSQLSMLSTQSATEIQQLKASLSLATNQLATVKKRALAMRDSLADVHNQSREKNQMREEYWTIIEEFVDPYK